MRLPYFLNANRTMPNPSRYDGSLEAVIRAHFGFTHAELARYLGVTARQIGNLEAGRR